MSISFGIRVVKESGSPHVGRKVHISIHGWTRGWLEEFTDDDGWVEFETEDSSSCTFSLSVSGEDMGEFTLEDGETISVTY